MQFVVNIPPFADVATLVAMGLEAERAGWDGVFYWDHVVWEREYRIDVFDPWVLLGAVAAGTERVRLGTMITPLPRRRPWMVAKHITTLDHLSSGRAVLGVGLGEPLDTDFAGFGEPSTRREQAALLDEGLGLLDGLLRGPVDHDGPHYRVRNELRPPPVQQPRPPIWVAAVAPHRRPLARAARWDGVVPIGVDDPLTPAALAGYLEAVERPPGWEVVVGPAAGVPPDEYRDAGATCLVSGAWPGKGWVDDLRTRIRRGPPAVR